MKKIELNLQKRLLIVEYETEAELKIEWALMNAFRNPNITNHGHKVKPICKGIEFNDEIAKDLVKSPDNFQFLDAENTFIGEIENQGYYWGENLIEQPFVEKYGWYTANSQEEESGWMYEEGEDKYYEALKEWQEAESKTFNPEKTLIFEILL